MTLLDKALQHQVIRNEPILVTRARDLKPKEQSEVCDLLDAALARRVNYSTAARVLSDFFSQKISDEMVRKHAATVLTECGR